VQKYVYKKMPGEKEERVEVGLVFGKDYTLNIHKRRDGRSPQENRDFAKV